MAVIVQLLVQLLHRALPLHSTRRHTAPLSHRHPRLHVRRVPARPDPRALCVGLARGAVHPAGGRRKEDAPAFAGACLPCGRSTVTIAHVFRHMQFGDKWRYRRGPCDWLGVGRQSGPRLGSVLGVDSARCFVQEVVSSWAGTFSESRCCYY
jgi:hypothetical protein